MIKFHKTSDDKITLTQVIFFEKLDFICDTSCAYFFIHSPLRSPENTYVLDIKTLLKVLRMSRRKSEKVFL